MKPIVRLNAFIVFVALSFAFAPASSQAGVTAAGSAKNCFFIRNNLACPCPKAQQARAVANAARVTAGALGSAIGTTAAALARADRNHGAPADRRNGSRPAAQTPKR